MTDELTGQAAVDAHKAAIQAQREKVAAARARLSDAAKQGIEAFADALKAEVERDPVIADVAGNIPREAAIQK